jgi:NDP-sugar pyrophosphorylase family protein
MQVAGSIIGRNCLIGKDAIVLGSYLLEGVRIHAGAQVSISDSSFTSESALCAYSFSLFTIICWTHWHSAPHLITGLQTQKK